MTKLEDRRYVLRYPAGVDSDGKRRWVYYRIGKRETERLNHAQLFSLSKAKNQKQFAQGSSLAPSCEIKRVTRKMLFVAALEGR